MTVSAQQLEMTRARNSSTLGSEMISFGRRVAVAITLAVIFLAALDVIVVFLNGAALAVLAVILGFLTWPYWVLICYPVEAFVPVAATVIWILITLTGLITLNFHNFAYGLFGGFPYHWRGSPFRASKHVR